MVGSILGTFLTGFFLIDLIGTKGVLLVLGTVHGVRGDDARLGLARRLGGSSAGPLRDRVPAAAACSRRWARTGASARRRANPTTTEDGFAWVDESNYYFIKVTNEPEPTRDRPAADPGARQPDPRLLHPRPSRAARLRLRAHLRPGGLSGRQGQRQDHAGAGQPADDPATATARAAAQPARAGLRQPTTRTRAEAPEPRRQGHRQSVKVQDRRQGQEDREADAGSSPRRDRRGRRQPHARAAQGRAIDADDPVPGRRRLHASSGTCSTPIRAPRSTSPRSTRPSPTPTSRRPACPATRTIKTYWGDARQFVERHQDSKQYDLIFGDAFNDFSVPWHLTTREFNEKIAKMLTPDRRLHDQHHRRLRVGRDRARRRPRR